MEFRLLSALEKVFSDEAPAAAPVTRVSLLRGDRVSVQAAFCCDRDAQAALTVSGAAPGTAQIFAVEDVPVGRACNDNADDFYLRKASGLYPDVLRPGDCCPAKQGRWQAFWIELRAQPQAEAQLTFALSAGGETAEAALTVETVAAELPAQALIHTNWYHADGLCNYYGIEAMSADFWRVNEAFLRMAAAHGINFILTPLFTPPLDTAVGHERTTVQLVGVRRRGGRYSFDFRNLRRWMTLCADCGIQYFELSHFFTQWGAKHAPKILVRDAKGRVKKRFGWQTDAAGRDYTDFLRQFAAALNTFLEKENVTDRCFVHISDEPGTDDLALYKKHAALIHALFPRLRVLDALSDFAFYEMGAVDLPVPGEGAIEAFRGRVSALWTYYCCGQGHQYLPNRFIAMPSLRNRVLGCLLYKYDCAGFLQWGYNFYNACLSLRPIDPYAVTDADGAFPSGDAFIVYPGPGGEPLPALRMKVFADGLRDLRALRLLESIIGREQTLALLEYGIPPLSFTAYPHDPAWLLGLRDRVNQKIKESFHGHSI